MVGAGCGGGGNSRGFAAGTKGAHELHSGLDEIDGIHDGRSGAREGGAVFRREKSFDRIVVTGVVSHVTKRLATPPQGSGEPVPRSAHPHAEASPPMAKCFKKPSVEVMMGSVMSCGPVRKNTTPKSAETFAATASSVCRCAFFRSSTSASRIL